MHRIQRNVWIYLIIVWCVPNAVNQFVDADTVRDHYQNAGDAAAAAAERQDGNQNRAAPSPYADDTAALQQRKDGPSRRNVDEVADINSKRDFDQQHTPSSAVPSSMPSAYRLANPYRDRVRRKKWRKKNTARSGGRLRIASKYSVTQAAENLDAARGGSAEMSPPVPSINVDISQVAPSRWNASNEPNKARKANAKKRVKPLRTNPQQIAAAVVPATTSLASSYAATAADFASRPNRNSTVDDLTGITAPHQTYRTSTDAVDQLAPDSGARRPLEYLHGPDVDQSPVIVGDLSCLKDTFRPAPTVPNADIKYLRNELLGQTNAYLEAEYICRPGFRLARTNHSTTVFCRNRRWIGHAPRCERKSPPASGSRNGTAPTSATAFPSSSAPIPATPSQRCPSTADETGRCHRPLCRSSIAANTSSTRTRSCRWCRSGFRLNATDNLCWDIDECRADANGAPPNDTICAVGAVCRNTAGSYRCDCAAGFQPADAEQPQVQSRRPHGSGSHQRQHRCTDINECRLRNGHGPCQDTCVNFDGGYRCSCAGLPGTALGADGHSCDDVDECLDNNGGCSHTCLNTFGRSFCVCPTGWLLDSDWKTCRDIDECSDAALCPQAECVNTLGSYRCVPPVSVAELETNAMDVPQMFESCPEGYAYQSAQPQRCTDIDECTQRPDQCHHICRNIDGGFRCSCYDGYTLAADKFTCQEARPANLSTIENDDNIVDTDPDNVSCPPLFPPKHGYLECSRPLPDRTSSGDNTGTAAAAVGHASNRPGSQCVLRCPTGYSESGRFEKICDFNGRWIGEEGGSCIKYQSPLLRCPPDIVVEVPPNDSRAHVHITAARTDVDWERNVRAQPAWAKRTDVLLPVGYVNVTLTATHPLAPELSVTCAFGITVLDGEPPIVQFCPRNHHHVLANADDEQHTQLSWTEPHFVDNINVTVVTKTRSPGSFFGVGSHRIVYTAQDTAGYKARCVFKLIVSPVGAAQRTHYHHQMQLPNYTVY